MRMGKIVGIDLGTTFSLVAVVEQGRPCIIADQGERLIPSVVGFSPKGELLVGTPAHNQYVVEPENTVKSIKRKMGTGEKVTLAGRQYTPQEISAFILRKLKQMAERDLGQDIERAVITVPAYFTDAARQATKDAGEIAGFEVARIINEPTAAALSYGLDKLEKEMKIMVFSFGGGTNDVTIMDFGGGVFEVLATSGDTKTGGTDLDSAVVQELLRSFRGQTGIDPSSDMMAMRRLKEAAEKAKIELSTLMTTDIDLPFISSDKGGPKHLHFTLTRAKLEQLTSPIIEKIREPIMRTLSDAKLTQEGVDKIILIGGQTRMPLVRKFVEDIMGKPAERGVDPMECVAVGAAIQGAVLAGEVKDILLLDVTPLSLG